MEEARKTEAMRPIRCRGSQRFLNSLSLSLQVLATDLCTSLLASEQNDGMVCKKAGEPLQMEQVEVAPPKAWEARIIIICTSFCHSDVTFWQMEVSHTHLYYTSDFLVEIAFYSLKCGIVLHPKKWEIKFGK